MISVANQRLTNWVAGRMGLPLSNDFNNIAWGTSQNTPFDIVGENQIVGNAKPWMVSAISWMLPSKVCASLRNYKTELVVMGLNADSRFAIPWSTESKL